MKLNIKEVKKTWGSETWFGNVSEDGKNYCGKILNLKKGYQGSYHAHKIKDEVFYLRSGLLKMKVEGQVFFMKQGDGIRLKPNTYHQFTGMEDTEIIEASTFHSDKDVYRKSESKMLDKDPWEELFEKKSILVVGDVMLDKYIYGEVKRISPEAPVPICKVTAEEYRLGGAANVALNLVKLGQDVTLIGLVGKDHFMLKHLLEKEYIGTHALVENITRQTTIKTRLIAKDHHIVRIDQEDTKPIGRDDLKGLRLPLNVDVVVFSDYGKGFLIPELVTAVMDKYGKKVKYIVDPKTDIKKYKGVDIIKPNNKEFEELIGIDNVVTIMKKIDVKYVLTTQGPQGFTIFEKGREGGNQYPIYNSNIVPVDITGAGDTFTATLAAAIATGFDVEESAKMANFASGLTIQHIGTYAPEMKEFRGYYATQPEKV